MSSIPLPALDIRPPQQQESPLDSYAKVLQMKGLMAQQQMIPGQLQEQQQRLQQGQMQNQMTQMDVQARQLFGQALQQSGGDYEKAFGIAEKNGANPVSLMPLKGQIVEYKQKLLGYTKEQQDFAKSQSDLIQGAYDKVNQAAPPDKAQVYAQQIAQLKQVGVQGTEQMPAQYPGDEAFAQVGTSLRAHSQLQEDAFKQAETNKNTQQAGEAQQNTLLAKAKADWYAKHGMAPGVSPDEAGMADWLQKNPGKGPADYQRYIKTLPINTRYSLENGAGLPGVGNGNGATPQAADVAKKFGMSQTSFDQAAEKYWTTGSLPPLGRGISGIALNRALMNRAGELHPQGSLAQNSAEFKANEQSLKQLQSNSDQMQAFENTAGKNLDVFLNTAKSVVDFGSPWVNKPMRAIDAGALGSKDQAAFNAGRQTAVNEISRVLNSTKGTGVVSDSARGEVEGLMGPNATLKQLYSAAQILRTDMKNRSESYAQQIADIKGRIGGGQGNQHPNNSAAPSAVGPNGHRIVVQNGRWVDAETGQPIR